MDPVAPSVASVAMPAPSAAPAPSAVSTPSDVSAPSASPVDDVVMSPCPSTPPSATARVMSSPASPPQRAPDATDAGPVRVLLPGRSPTGDAQADPPAPNSPLIARRLSFGEAVSDSHEPSLSPSMARPRPRGLLPSPEALAAVRRLYDDKDNNPAAILAAAKQAQPESIPDALFSITAKVSFQLFGVTRPAIVLGLAAVRDNEAVRSVVKAGEIIHVHRQPRNELLLYLRSENAKVKLAGQRCTFMGRTLTFDTLNPLSDAFYLDVLGIRSDAVASRLFTGFMGLGCQPIYFNFTYRAPDTAITSGIVRFYFNQSTCPMGLVVDGHVCDQVALGGILYSARARGAQAVQYHLSPNKLSPHALRFGVPGRSSTSRSSTHAALSGEKRSRVTDAAPVADTTAGLVVSTDDVSMSSCEAETLAAGEDPSPTIAPAAQSNSVFNSPPRKRLARRTPSPAVSPTPAFTSPNYWDALDQVSVDITTHQVSVGDSVASLQLAVQAISSPKEVLASTEFTHPSEVRRGKVRRASKPVSISKMLPLLDEDVVLQKALLHRELEATVTADNLVPSRAEEQAVTSDDLRRSMAKNHLRFLGKLFRLMRTKAPLLDDFVRVHLISRAVAAGTADTCASIADKWKSLFGERCPKSRLELFERADKWMVDSSELELYRISEALALFELLVMAAAPSIHGKDGWIHVICGFDAPWIGGAPPRLLHPNALLGLLRSDVGGSLLSEMKSMNLEHRCVDALTSLQSSSLWLPWDGGVLSLADTSLGLAWSTGSVLPAEA